MLSRKDYSANGKLLLTGEYYVLEGAFALALPTSRGQKLSINEVEAGAEPPDLPKSLQWTSFDVKGDIWLKTAFSLPHLNLNKPTTDKRILTLQNILQTAKQLNPNFLKNASSQIVFSYADFPFDWGLGSSSTLICNIAQWAEVDAFELLFKTMGGSGYDIACGMNDSPIIYQKEGGKTNVQAVNFDPPFAENLYFVHLGKKQNSRDAIKYFYETKANHAALIEKINALTVEILTCSNLTSFQRLLLEHEELIASSLKLTRAQHLYFGDYWGIIKSLGAWGGDFVMATSNRTFADTKAYFYEKGFDTILPYEEIIL